MKRDVEDYSPALPCASAEAQRIERDEASFLEAATSHILLGARDAHIARKPKSHPSPLGFVNILGNLR